MKDKDRQPGDRYRPIVTINKMKKGKPTVLQISGRRYVLDHKDQFKGNKQR